MIFLIILPLILAWLYFWLRGHIWAALPAIIIALLFCIIPFFSGENTDLSPQQCAALEKSVKPKPKLDSNPEQKSAVTASSLLNAWEREADDYERSKCVAQEASEKALPGKIALAVLCGVLAMAFFLFPAWLRRRMSGHFDPVTESFLGVYRQK